MQRDIREIFLCPMGSLDTESTLVQSRKVSQSRPKQILFGSYRFLSRILERHRFRIEIHTDTRPTFQGLRPSCNFKANGTILAFVSTTGQSEN